MRLGRNPKKSELEKIKYKFHRVIIPVFIPNFDGFFKDSLNVFKYCFDSLENSINSEYTNITIIDNECCAEVKAYLEELVATKRIDKLVVNSINYGKVQPIISEARASTEELITFSDADVFYSKGWEKSTFDLFLNFPKTGAVSSLVNPSLYNYANESCLLDNLLPYNRIKSGIISDPKPIILNSSLYVEDMLGVENEYVTREILEKHFYIEKNDIKAFIGCGHQSVTMKRDILFADIHKRVEYIFYDKMRIEYNNYDKYVSDLGYWRLTTAKNFAYHLGNTFQKIEADDKNNYEISDIIVYQNLKDQRSNTRFLPFKIKTLLLKILLRLNKIYYQYK